MGAGRSQPTDPARESYGALSTQGESLSGRSAPVIGCCRDSPIDDPNSTVRPEIGRGTVHAVQRYLDFIATGAFGEQVRTAAGTEMPPFPGLE